MNKGIRDKLREADAAFRVCLTKKTYKSEKGAKMAIEFHPEKAGIRAYDCPHCGYWHITSKPHRDHG